MASDMIKAVLAAENAGREMEAGAAKKAEKMLSDATENFTTGFMCSESVLEVLNRHYELGIGEEAIALSMRNTPPQV